MCKTNRGFAKVILALMKFLSKLKFGKKKEKYIEGKSDDIYSLF